MDNGNDGTAMGRYWSEDADNYDGIVRSELNSFRASAWTAFFERRLNPASRVLDFGCGPGFFTVLLARLGHDVTAVDISSRMARAAGRNAAEFAARRSTKDASPFIMWKRGFAGLKPARLTPS